MDGISVPDIAPLIRDSFRAVYPWDGTTTVRVSLDNSGSLRDASVANSSGNPWLDRAALQGARLAHYAAATVNCSAVSGNCLIVVEFHDAS